MSFSNSAGVYSRVVDRSFVVTGAGLLTGGIVVSANRGPTTPNLVTSAREFVDTYGTPSRDNPSLHSAIRFLNRANALTVLRVINDATAASGDINNDETAPEPVISVDAANPGVWGNDVSITFAEITGSTDSFLLIVKEGGVQVEEFEVSRDLNAKNGYGRSIYIEDVINGRSDYITVTDDTEATGSVDLTQEVTLSGGSDDTDAPAEGDISTAWDQFKVVDDVDAQVLINGGWASAVVQQKMLEVAQIRDDAVAILDVPEADSTDVSAMITYKDDTLAANTYYGGLYGGWLRVYDQYNDREVNIPPSGDVAGAFVFTVSQGERWDAPAGLQRGIIPNVLGVTKVFTEGERDTLYVNGINPVSTMSGAAAVIWGQKTLIQPDSTALSRFNVVNSLLWMQNRMKEALQPFVFEPNTQFTRDNVNYLLSSFLENIQSRGGLYGFYVDTGSEINTPQVIDSNQMMVEVHVQPTRTAEFIRMSLIVQRTGVQLG